MALAEVEFEVIFRVFKDIKSTPVNANFMPLVLTALQIPIKEGAKSTMFLPSMVQSAFPD